MAPPSRAGLALRAAKQLEGLSEDLLSLTPSATPTLAASKVNGVYTALDAVISTLAVVKDMCDQGMNSYPNYPRVREALMEAGNQVYRCKEEVSEIKTEFLSTPVQELMLYRGFAVRMVDIASKLRAVNFVAKPRKTGEAANG